MTELHDQAIAALPDSAPDGILVVDEEGAVVLVNQAAEQLFGFGSGELLGRSVDTLVALSRGDLLGLRKDASEFPVEISRSPVTWQGRTLVVTIVRDVTQRRLIEEERLRL